jgi:hypothetical protein
MDKQFRTSSICALNAGGDLVGVLLRSAGSALSASYAALLNGGEIMAHLRSERKASALTVPDAA